MARIPEPWIITPRNNANSFQFTLNYTCGLPREVCKKWQRRSFMRLPDELSQYRNPKSMIRAKASVQALIGFLKNQEIEDSALRATKVKTNKEITIYDFAKDMFVHGAAHLKRWEAKGNILKEQTIKKHRGYLINYLLPEFGKLKFDEIKPTLVEDFLLEQKLSNSCKNSITHTLQLVMREANRAGIMEIIPELEPFKRNSRRQDALSSEELNALFPYDDKELIEIWRRPDGMRKEPPEIALMFGTLFCVTVSAGLRSGEIRAMYKNQVSFDNSGIIVDKAIDEAGIIGPLKKATEENPRSRAVIIPEVTLAMLERWMGSTRKHSCNTDLLFSYRKKPISGWYILDRFNYGLKNVGIDFETRRLTVHCLRYTYNTRMKMLLSPKVLREFIGHKSESMTEHYDRPFLLERMASLQGEKQSVNLFWGEDKNVIKFKAS